MPTPFTGTPGVPDAIGAVNASPASDQNNQNAFADIGGRQQIKGVVIDQYAKDGTPWFKVNLGDGLPISVGSMEGLQAFLDKAKADGNLPQEALDNITNSTAGNGALSFDANGGLSWAGTDRRTGESITTNPGGKGVTRGDAGSITGTGTVGGSGSQTPSSTTSTSRPPTGGPQTGSASNNGGAGPGGGGRTTAGGGGSTTTTSGGGGLSVGGGGAGGGAAIDPNAPLGVGFGGAEGSFTPGDQQFNNDSIFNSPDSFTQGLGEDASLNDILLGAMGEQRATRDAALGIQGGLASSFENNGLRQQNEQNALALGANPFSLDDQTVQRIMGQQGDLIGQNTERLQQSSAARAASSGISRSGIQNSQQNAIDVNGARQLGDAQRGLLVEQATRRPGELSNAIGVGNQTLNQQQTTRGDIAGGAVNILAQSNPTADAALLGTLANGGTPQINIGDRANPFNPAGRITR